MEGGEERKKRFAERSLRTALPHEGASGPAVDTCCLCGNERCRPCRSKGTRHAQNHQHNSATERKNSLCCRILLKLSLTAGGAPRQRRMEADRMAAPQGPCPLSGGARLTGIESRDDAPPRRMAMRHGEGRGAEEKVRGAEPGEAQLHEGASGPAVDTCCLCPCGTRAAFAATNVAARGERNLSRICRQRRQPRKSVACGAARPRPAPDFRGFPSGRVHS